SSDFGAQREINLAFKLFLTIDVLDVSRSGNEVWEAAKKAYNDKIDRAESQITARLREQLGSAKSSSEMFQVFSQFNSLFFRPRIRGAIQEYQSILIQQVKEDLKKLQNKYLIGYTLSEAANICTIRNISPIAGSIVWARQIERRLQNLLKRIEDVLGRGWEQHSEGQPLKQDVDVFLSKLDPLGLFEQWLRDMKDIKRIDDSSKIFTIRKLGGRGYDLQINYPMEVLFVFKEVQHLQSMQFRVPYSIKILSDESKLCYPFATLLQETVRSYLQTNMHLQEREMGSAYGKATAALVSFFRKEVQELLAEGMHLSWNSSSLELFTRKLSDKVFLFERKVEDAFHQSQLVLDALEKLRFLSISKANVSEFFNVLKTTQTYINEFRLQNFSNIKEWFVQIDVQVETYLLERLTEVMKKWIEEFSHWPAMGTSLVADGFLHEFKVRNQVLQLFPPTQAARQYWYGHLHQTMGLIAYLPRLRCTSTGDTSHASSGVVTQKGEEMAVLEIPNPIEGMPPHTITYPKDSSYRHIVLYLDNSVLESAYDAIEGTVNSLTEYAATWLQYQSLWDVDVNEVLLQMEDSIDVWRQLLSEIKASRSTFDTSETRRVIGPLVVDYRQIQVKVNTKYDQWHRDILNAFGNKVHEKSVAISHDIQKRLQDLELQNTFQELPSGVETLSVGGADLTALTFLSLSDIHCEAFFSFCGTSTGGLTPTEDPLQRLSGHIITFIRNVQEGEDLEAAWPSRIEALRMSERLLQRQRYAFPSEWLWIDTVEGAWETFQQLLHHQAALLQQRFISLYTLVKVYHHHIQTHLGILYDEWKRNRPIHFDIPPSQALRFLHTLEQRLVGIRGDFDKAIELKSIVLQLLLHLQTQKVTPLIAEASASLFSMIEEFSADLQPSATIIGGAPFLRPDALEEEILSLKGVWTELKRLHDSVLTISETQWSIVLPKKIRLQLEDMLQTIKKIPARFRQYEAFEDFNKTVEEYLSLNLLVTEMKTEALKERHWKQILQKLRLKVSLSEMTIGNIWAADLKTHEQAIKEILSQAQGELAVEEFLRNIKDHWTDYELELVNYQNKCKLIRGWDDLFQLIDDHLNALQSMKLSPYFKLFEEDALNWDKKLNRLRLLLDSWKEVQRKWIYLEGVFKGSSDIQLLLPNEYQRFKTIDSEFLGIMKKAANKPKLLDLVAIEGFQKQLDRLSDLLSKVQKALGEYLSKQRADFPRFYFVGDEDLLEMIGNAKVIGAVQRHLNKMFAGITYLCTDTDDLIHAMRSKEGEEVPFIEPISIKSYSSLKEWLSAVEKSMYHTMATVLDASVFALRDIDIQKDIATTKDGDLFNWIGIYPSQIVLLALQIDWTDRCEKALSSSHTMDSLTAVLNHCLALLTYLADKVVGKMAPVTRQKIVQIMTELVHQRDVLRYLIVSNVASVSDFRWLQYMRFY
ncbi:dynein heavy chain family protein, partial [Cardiosporidium cionae]